ncbi:MAG: 2-oxo acid dehydrogenase subunit E2 [Fimbriimonadaceae bacterium]|nr:2-oxo acid dehydrogenase subunit E2 [Fimbriimonadaceae bacterium]QYK55215.1 MAG: 2-oxo acid dehydrogenase subunit E2 [Fimbriimonadaceae bacterium]
MPVEILMPELGESVHEGTVSRWLKKIGDYVKEDEPVVEIMTDKVNTELGAPSSGVLVKIMVEEGGEVEVFHAMGLIEADEAKAKEMIADVGGAAASTPNPTQAPAKPTETPAPAPENGAVEPAAAQSGSDGKRKWFSPLVRSMAKDAGVSEAELAQIVGSGAGGRVNKKDLQDFIDRRGATPVAGRPGPATAPAADLSFAAAAPASAVAGASETHALVGMRKMIAEAMTRSSQVPVVSTLIEVDVTNLVKFREINKDSFQAQFGVKLTYTPFFIKALTDSLLEFPYLNASLVDGQVTLYKGVHMGVAVSLGERGEGGLIVPVIRDCQSKSLVEIARDLEQIAANARGNKLGVADVQGGTFTLTNPGSYGAVLGTPMINAPQSGIIGAYGITKKPVIIDDMIAVRSVMNLVLTYDHRLVDGLTAGRFLQAVKGRLEKFDFYR